MKMLKKPKIRKTDGRREKKNAETSAISVQIVLPVSEADFGSDLSDLLTGQRFLGTGSLRLSFVFFVSEIFGFFLHAFPFFPAFRDLS